MNHLNTEKLRAYERVAERNALDDRALMRAMIGVIRDALHTAVCKVELMSVDLKHVDAEQLMVDIRHEFDPNTSTSYVLEAFGEAFAPTWNKRLSAHFETLWDKDETSACTPREPVNGSLPMAAE